MKCVSRKGERRWRGRSNTGSSRSSEQTRSHLTHFLRHSKKKTREKKTVVIGMDAKEHSWEGDYADFDQRSRIITQLSLFLSVLFPVVRTENRESSTLCVVTSRKWVRARFPDLGATFFRLRIRIAKLSWKERDNNHTEGKKSKWQTTLSV